MTVAPRPSQSASRPESAVALIVNPIEEDRTSLRRILPAPDWMLYEAGHLRDALDILRARRIPVILCERDLLVGDWVALLDAIQLLPRPPYLIVTSRQADNHLWAAVLNFGGYDVLPVPFHAAEVVRVVRSALAGWMRRWEPESFEPPGAVA